MAEPADAHAPWLVADLGGTNLRFGLATRGAGGWPLLEAVQALPVSAYASLPEAATHYLRAQRTAVRGAVLSVAGRVVDGAVAMTNLPWRIEARTLAQALGTAEVHIVNDLAAAAAALPALADSEAPLLWPLPRPRPPAQGLRRVVVLGAGTGLGIAGAHLHGRQVKLIDTEGGHAGYAPANATEDRLLAALRADSGRVSWEHVASGVGLARLHRLLAAAAQAGDAARSPEQIVAAWQQGHDSLCTQAVELMLQALAAAAGDSVLMQGAWDGVYLSGALPNALRRGLEAPAFRARFLDKGPFAEAMTQVPVRLVAHTQPVLLGAACMALALAAQAGSVASEPLFSA